MNNKETLINLIQNTQLSKKELSRKLDKYLYTNYDSMLVKMIRDQLMKLDIPEEINEERIIEIIKLFDEDAQIQTTQKEENEKQKEENNTLQEAYNTMYIENSALINNIKQKDQTINELKNKNNELESQNKQILNRLDKLEGFLERFKKYNVTEFNDLIELEDDIINQIYINYLQDGTNTLENGYIFEHEDSLIIPKSYYKVEKESK